MHVNLTITIEEELISKSKIFAKKQGRSLSSLIGNYLRAATREDTDETKISKKIIKLRGAIKDPAISEMKTKTRRSMR
jgi:hypothetical protein